LPAVAPPESNFNISRSGSQIDSTGRVLFTADAHRDNGRRSIVQSDEKLTAFLELERMTSVASSVWRAHADVGYLVCRLQRESFPSLAA